MTHSGDTWRNTSQTYDALNRVITETSLGIVHSHTYDKAGNRLVTLYGHSNRLLSRTYDAGNRLVTQQDVRAGEDTKQMAFGYDPQGNLTLKVLPDASTEARIFDNRNRVREMRVRQPDVITIRLLVTYEYDLVGNLIRMGEVHAGGAVPARVVICGYDGTHRLTTETDQRAAQPVVLTNFVYDKADNRTQKTIYTGGVPSTTTYVIGDGANGAGANQIVSYSRQNSTVVNYAYDLNGSRVSRTDAGLSGVV